MKLEVVQLKKYFGSTRAVDDVSFTIGSGQIMGFVGPNGAGKTTTMKILATLDEPTFGDAYIDGVSITEYPEKARELIGYVPDSLQVHTNISVHDYLDFFARAYGIKRSKRLALVESLEDFTNLTGIGDKMLVDLSKGMKQRVCLARSLVNDPPILLLDEPAAGLDPRARIELRELLKVLASRGKAVLISSHILTELAEICNAALIIEQGKLLRAGTLEEIVTQDRRERTLLINVLEMRGELHKDLLVMPNVLSATPAGNGIEIVFDGDEKACAALLTELINRGFAVTEFHHQKSDLEDVFMKVTRGDVQ